MSGPIFVFGSNEAGIHGAGAARFAVERHGAVMGRGVGFQGNSYGIPTKDHQIQTLPLPSIAGYVRQFLREAAVCLDTTFHVTQIGCGLAGLEPKDIAPMFHDAPSNCQFSSAWEPWLPGRVYWTDK